MKLSKTQQRGTLPAGSPGKRLYAIGDVHGCYDEMCQLLAKIKNDHFSKVDKECILIFLGDLVDRGPRSADVVAHLRCQAPTFAKTIFIKGNHEEMMVRTLTGEADLIPDWLRHGGKQCAISYGINPAHLCSEDPEYLEHLLLSYIPQEDLQFLHNFIDSVWFGDFFLVHAGVRPGVALEEQSSRDLRWIRGEFLKSNKDFGAVVVHGHTVSDEVVHLPNRIGLDTGAHKGGSLTSICIEGTDVSFLSVSAVRSNAKTPE